MRGVLATIAVAMSTVLGMVAPQMSSQKEVQKQVSASADELREIRNLTEDLRNDQEKLFTMVADTKKTADAVNEGLESFRPAPTTAECKCDCPTLEQIRAVVREELARVTVTLRSGATVQATVNEPLKLNPGEVVTHIDGVPVQASAASNGSSGGTMAYSPSVVTRVYATPTYQAQSYTSAGSTQVVVRSTGPIRRALGFQTTRTYNTAPRTCVRDPVTGQVICN